MSDLTTLDNARIWTGATTSDDALLSRLITAISAEIETWIGYRVLSQSYTKSFNGPGGARLMLPDRPITAVSAVAVDGVAILPAADAGQVGFTFDATGVWLRGYAFTRGVQNVAISYTAGFDTVPGDIEQACLDWLNSAYAGRDRDPSLISRKAGDTAETFDGVTRLGRLAVPMPATVYAALSARRRVVPA